MEIEVWWLLVLPIFFGLGWVAARIDIRHLVRESRTLPRSYFEGLCFLLNEKPDQAIEAFIEASRVDPETIEIHFARQPFPPARRNGSRHSGAPESHRT